MIPTASKPTYHLGRLMVTGMAERPRRLMLIAVVMVGEGWG